MVVIPYIPKKKFLSKSPEGREAQLANLKQNWGRHRPIKMQGSLPKWGVYKKKKPYQGDILEFAGQFVIPETERPIVLEQWQIDNIIRPIFYSEEKPSLALLSLCKKNGKSALASFFLLFKFFSGEPRNELYVCASDKDQGKSIVFNKALTSIKMNPYMITQCIIRDDYIMHKDTQSIIKVLPNDWRSAAGYNPGMIVVDELFAFDLESAERFYNELQLGPTRRDPLTLITSTAGYSQSGLLWELWEKGLKNIPGSEGYNPDYYSFISHDNLASWVTDEWLSKQKKKMRAPLYNRLHKNEWQSGEENFITDELYRGCVDPFLVRQPKRRCQVFCGVDVAIKHDCAVVAVVEKLEDRINLVDHFIVMPEGEKIDLEDTIEAFILEISKRYDIINLLYDPYQFARSAATLEKRGIVVQEWPQTQANTTRMSQNLYSLIKNRSLGLYDEPVIREHLINCQAKETPRGWRIVKGRQKSKKIDFAIALAQACLGAVQEEEEESGEFEVFAGNGWQAGYGG